MRPFPSIFFHTQEGLIGGTPKLSDENLVTAALATYTNASSKSSTITALSFMKHSTVLAELSSDLDAFKQSHS